MPVAEDDDDPYIDVSRSRGVVIGDTSTAVYNVFYPMRQAIDRLPDDPGIAPLKDELERGMARIESRLSEIDQSSYRSGKRLFVLGLILGLPLGILGSYLAYLLGIN